MMMGQSEDGRMGKLYSSKILVFPSNAGTELMNDAGSLLVDSSILACCCNDETPCLQFGFHVVEALRQR